MSAAVVEERIARFAEKAPRLLVAWSGGKDSTVALLAAMRCCREKTYAAFIHVVGQTHAVNSAAVLAVAEKLRMNRVRAEAEGRRLKQQRGLPSPPALIYVISKGRLGKGFWAEAEKRGWPVPVERTRYKGKRWCCQVFKTEPLEALASLGFRWQIAGIKAADSSYRARLLADLDPSLPIRHYNGYTTLFPVFDMDDDMVWEILRQYDNEVYRIVTAQYEVFGYSPNCTVCPLQSKKNFKRTVRIMPDNWLIETKKKLEALAEQSCSKGKKWSCRDLRTKIHVISGELAARKWYKP